MIRKTLLALFLAGLLFAALSCRTVEGLGQDISNAGHAVGEAIGVE